jgi:2-polyprenyl-3-methyl-5-hydroxy-6-metoxy-1,4-benzoquinol methylase
MKGSDAVDYFSQAAGEFNALYDSHSDFQERLRVWYPLIDKYVKEGGLALDMGCGAGVFSFYLAGKGARVIGIDASEKMLELCMRQKQEHALHEIRFLQAEIPHLNGLRLPKANLIVCSSVLEYIEEFEEALVLFAKILKDQGTFIVSLPNAICPNRMYQRLKFRFTGNPEIYKYIKNYVTPRRTASLLEAHGLRMVEKQYYAHPYRMSKLTRALRLPPSITADLFVAVFVKEGNSSQR